MINSFKYGQNPHEVVIQSDIPKLSFYPHSSISLNTYLDINCGYVIAGNRIGQLIYCKHAAPLFSSSLASGNNIELLRRAIDFNERRDFGTYVYTSHLTADFLSTISTLRFHTLAAPSATDAAIDMFLDPDFQTRNRGATLVLGEFLADPCRKVRLSSAHQQIEYALTSPAGDDFSEFMERIVRELRTLSAAVFVDGELMSVGCGYFDPLELMDNVLAPFIGRELHLTVASDACFSVKDPTELLLRAGVTALHLFGGKQEHVSLVEALRRNGIAAHLHPDRAFRY